MLAERFYVPEIYFVAIAIAGATIVGAIFFLYLDYPIEVDVPIVGIGVRYTKWLAALLNVRYARQSIREGYAKAIGFQYGDFAFQIPTMTRMDIFICDRQMTREYQNVDDQHLSFRAVMTEEFQFKWLLPGQAHEARMIPNSVMAKALSWQRTRASKPSDPFFEAFSAEFIHGFQEEMRRLTQHQNSSFISSLLCTIPDARSGWHAVPCFPLALKVIARLTTYSLFGEPLCRDAAFLDVCCRFGDAIPRDALILRSWPGWARPFILKLLAAPRLVRKLRKILDTEIKSRRDSREKNLMKDILDFTMAWVDHRPETSFDDWHIADMMINTIFAGLHTSSQLVVHTIFELATRPEYADALREEVKACFEQHGKGTKAALDSMHKVDSFIKETQRFNPLDASALARLALKDFTFSNGLHIPKGSVIFTPSSPIFEDERYFTDPKRFDGFRFARMRNDPKLNSSCDLTSTNEQSMHFGIGRHACPGRFMVSDEVKLAMVHLLQNFDFCVENFGPRPKNQPFGKFILPDMSAKVWLRETTGGKG
uniref:p450 monooxygenase n=1 Tax=Periglandula ipomoeae TaxID=1037530 RepID=J7FI31_9HYPO|nr:P450 monooxygenase [Periglandula ipomoeae]